MMCQMDRPVETARREAAGIADADVTSPPPARPVPSRRDEGGTAPGISASTTSRAAPDGGTRVPDLNDAIAQAQRGDPDAFRVLYRDIQPRILRYLSALVGRDTEDVASETWLHVARDLHGFHGDSDGFRGWVATIARHRATDHLRRHGRRPQVVPVPVEEFGHLAGKDDTAASALDTVATDAAIALIATLPPDQAEAVLLRVVIGLDAETAGKVLGKRAGAVRTAAYRGIHTLASHLDQQDEQARPGNGGIDGGGALAPPAGQRPATRGRPR
jgi:RNA polymerase sigma-70 factor, ECF subfamily